jgi:acetoin utilization protein AcuC
LKRAEAVFVYSEDLENFPYPSDCPFSSSRAGRVHKVVDSMGLIEAPYGRRVKPDAADEKELMKFHTPRYLDVLKAAGRGDVVPGAFEMGIGTIDCPAFAGVYEGAALATGATLAGLELIEEGRVGVAFNPAGGFHHAGPSKASGFCYINDVALASLIFAQKGRRVLYLDVDVHFGDGVAHAFYDSCEVLTVSLHHDPRFLFPGCGFIGETGAGGGEGYCVNVPLPVGTYDEAYLKAFRAVVPPLAESFNADVVVFELGADALSGDPLAALALTNNVYVEVIDYLKGLGKPILCTGGGGYNIDNTVRAWSLAWALFAGGGSEQDVAGAGGVLLENIDWPEGLRDRQLAVDERQRRVVDAAVDRVIEAVRSRVFPHHGL